MNYWCPLPSKLFSFKLATNIDNIILAWEQKLLSSVALPLASLAQCFSRIIAFVGDGLFMASTFWVTVNSIATFTTKELVAITTV